MESEFSVSTNKRPPNLSVWIAPVFKVWQTMADALEAIRTMVDNCESEQMIASFEKWIIDLGEKSNISKMKTVEILDFL